jgi:hypothetical protein
MKGKNVSPNLFKAKPKAALTNRQDPKDVSKFFQ